MALGEEMNYRRRYFKPKRPGLTPKKSSSEEQKEEEEEDEEEEK